MDESISMEVLEHLFEGVYFVDRDRRILLWNRAAEELTGFKREEVIGKKCADGLLRHMSDTGEELCLSGCPLHESIETGRKIRPESTIFLHHKDGYRVPISVRAAPMRNAKGEIIGAVEMFHHAGDEEALKERMRMLEELAYIDTLTGLPNRRYLVSSLESRLDELSRYDWPFGVLFIDVDHFKRINDTLGHEAGDLVLKTIGSTLRGAARSFDLVGRWGGEEFVAVIANCIGEQIASAAERFRKLVAGSGLRQFEGLKVTISVGATSASASDTPDTLVKRADEALYEAKETGRNKVVFKI